MLKKILLITPSINMGGMQKAMVTLANGLVENGIDISMYALFHHDHFFKLSSKIHFTEADDSINKVGALKRIIKIILNVRRELKKYTGDVVIVYGKFYSSLVLLAASGLRKRVFISDRASPLYRDFWYVECLTSLIYYFCKPTGIIAQTSDSAKFQRKRFGSKIPIEVIPNAVNLPLLKPAKREKIVLAVGRFKDPLKGFDRLIEAWCKTKREDWKLFFVGGTESEEPSFVQKLKAEGIKDSVCFLGKQSNIFDFYLRCSIFVIPSRSEGFPNALVEAMCCGCACISFDFMAGPRDIIEDGFNGLIVPNNDTDMLADAITQLIHSPEKCITLSHNAVLGAYRFEQKNIMKRIITFVS